MSFLELRNRWKIPGKKCKHTVRNKQDSRISISHDTSRNNWDLIITDLKFEDSGVYECQVPSSNKNVRQHIFLRVKGIIILANFSSIYI